MKLPCDGKKDAHEKHVRPKAGKQRWCNIEAKEPQRTVQRRRGRILVDASLAQVIQHVFDFFFSSHDHLGPFNLTQHADLPHWIAGLPAPLAAMLPRRRAAI
jgi:hypothetical protein